MKENNMKTLVNKNNPQIRITAEVETLYDKSRCVKYYYIKDLRLGLLQENWTLVEEESKYTEVWLEGRTIFEQDAKKPTEGIKGNLEEFPSNVDLEQAAEDFVWEVMENDENGISELSRKLRPSSKISDYYDALAEFFKAGAKWAIEQLKEK